MRKPTPRKVTSTNYRNEADLIAGCPLAAAMKLVGGRWKLMLLWYVSHDIRRFAALKLVMVGISEKMLYQQLRELETHGLLMRTVTNRRAVMYALTPLGASLLPQLRALAQWSEQHGIAGRLLAPSGATGLSAFAPPKGEGKRVS
jgi:DNA-binding HxlR family transcriptional regulator